MSESLFLKTCNGFISNEKPVWFMRQAGRYLPEYMEVRNQFKTFLDFVHDSDAAAKVTVQPIDRFGLDAAILFSDILVLLPTLGIDVKFLPGEGPRIETPLQNANAIKNLKDPQIEKELFFTKDAIEKTQLLLNNRAPLLGFIGGPLTLASYAIEGKTSKDLHQVKKLFYQNPEAYHTLLEKISITAGEYLALQAKWGCDALVVMDSWAGHLSKEDYQKMALPYSTKVIEMAKQTNVPVLHYANGSAHLLSEFLKLPASGFGLDWRTPLKTTLIENPKTVFQGNLDPAMLFAPQETIKKRVREILDLTRNRAHIMNLGHGILPGTPIEGVKTFVETVREYI